MLAPPANNLSATTTVEDENGNCNGTATVTVSGGVSPYYYLWSTGDTTANTDSLCAGNYSCNITDSDGDTIIVSVDILLTNISKIGGEEIMVKVYPNPGKGVFNVKWKMENGNRKNSKLVVFNLPGEIIFSQPILNGGEIKIDISPYGAGIYYLKVMNENGNSIPVKIIVN